MALLFLVLQPPRANYDLHITGAYQLMNPPSLTHSGGQSDFYWKTQQVGPEEEEFEITTSLVTW